MTAITPSRAGLSPVVGNGAQFQKTAQAAFFQAALGQVAPAKAAEPASVNRTPQVKDVASSHSEAKAPSPWLRPGSLLDIRV